MCVSGVVWCIDWSDVSVLSRKNRSLLGRFFGVLDARVGPSCALRVRFERRFHSWTSTVYFALFLHVSVSGFAPRCRSFARSALKVASLVAASFDVSRARIAWREPKQLPPVCAFLSICAYRRHRRFAPELKACGAFFRAKNRCLVREGNWCRF